MIKKQNIVYFLVNNIKNCKVYKEPFALPSASDKGTTSPPIIFPSLNVTFKSPVLTTNLSPSKFLLNKEQGGIVSGATESHQLRVWVSNSAPSSVIGNGIGLKLKVLSEVDTSK